MLNFGYVDLKEASAAEKVNEATELQNRFVRVAYEKIFANSPIEKFLQLDMVLIRVRKLIWVPSVKCLRKYVEAKKHAIEGASKVVDVQDIKEHIGRERIDGRKSGKTQRGVGCTKTIFLSTDQPELSCSCKSSKTNFCTRRWKRLATCGTTR